MDTLSRAVDMKLNTLLSKILESSAELFHVIHGWVTGKLSQRSPALGAAKASYSTYTSVVHMYGFLRVLGGKF